MEDPSAIIEAHHKRVEELNAERFELEPNATSLTLLQKVYRSPSLPLLTRIRAATAALPHEHSKLAVMAAVSAEDFADQLEKANERSRRVLIEAKPMIEANVSNTANVSTDTKPPISNSHKPFVPDRRYRRR
jgi:hypothetical protein